MRLPTTLGLVVAAVLLVQGGAFPAATDLDVASGSKRALRTVHFGKAGFADSEEERGFTWSNLKQVFSGNSTDEESIIKLHADQFACLNRKDMVSYDIYLKRIRSKDSHEEAMKWGLRFEQYQKNPQAYTKAGDTMSRMRIVRQDHRENIEK